MALSKLRELHDYESKMSRTMTAYFDILKKQGMLGDHFGDQVNPNAEGSTDIFHLVGSNGDKSTACRLFQPRDTGKQTRYGFMQFELDILQELFEFDRRALGGTLKEAQPGFYHIQLDGNLEGCLRGRHFNEKQAAEIIRCMRRGDTHEIIRTLEDKLPWCVDEWLPCGKDERHAYIKECIEAADGFVPPDFLRKAVRMSCERAQHYKGDPNHIFGPIMPPDLPFQPKLEWNFEVGINGPAVTTDIRVDMTEPFPMELGSLSFDIVTCAKLCFWPDDASDFLTRERSWPAADTIKECERFPVQIVPKFSSEGDQNEWYLSFVFQERILAEARSQVMKFTFYAFKVLFYKHMKGVKLEGVEVTLSTYLAKTTMLWACEELPPSEWTNENIGANLQLLFVKLLSWLECGELQHYFVPEVNILSNTPKELLEKSVEFLRASSLLTDPVQSLPSEDEIVQILAIHRMVYDFLSEKYEDAYVVFRDHPWGFI